MEARKTKVIYNKFHVKANHLFSFLKNDTNSQARLKSLCGTTLMAQWIRICLPKGTGFDPWSGQVPHVPGPQTLSPHSRACVPHLHS